MPDKLRSASKARDSALSGAAWGVATGEIDSVATLWQRRPSRSRFARASRYARVDSRECEVWRAERESTGNHSERADSVIRHARSRERSNDKATPGGDAQSASSSSSSSNSFLSLSRSKNVRTRTVLSDARSVPTERSRYVARCAISYYKSMTKRHTAYSFSIYRHNLVVKRDTRLSRAHSSYSCAIFG